MSPTRRDLFRLAGIVGASAVIPEGAAIAAPVVLHERIRGYRYLHGCLSIAAHNGTGNDTIDIFNLFVDLRLDQSGAIESITASSPCEADEFERDVSDGWPELLNAAGAIKDIRDHDPETIARRQRIKT